MPDGLRPPHDAVGGEPGAVAPADAHLPARTRTAGVRSSGANELFQRDPRWRDYVPFYEYFHGDTGAGLGASHQTGWTALVAKLLDQTDGR